MNPEPRVLIILLTWNHWEVTAACLHALSRLTYPNYDVLVVDNGSADGTPDHIRADFPAVDLIENGRNLGFAAGCNVGLRQALAQQVDYALLLNNDTLVEPDMLAQLIAAAGQLPDAGLLAPQMRYADRPAAIWFSASRRHPWTLEARDFGPQGPRRHMPAGGPIAVDYIFGTAMLLSARALRAVGGFDEAFFMYYEDMDLCLRLQAAGFKLYYVPQARLYHQVSASTERAAPLRYGYKARSSVIFFRKHVHGWRWLVVIPYRLGSLTRTTLRLVWQGEWAALRAYWRGWGEGLRWRAAAVTTLRPL